MDRAIVRVYTVSGTWDVDDTLDVDMYLIETGSTLNDYYDGAYEDSLGFLYAWTGTADASTSTATPRTRWACADWTDTRPATSAISAPRRALPLIKLHHFMLVAPSQRVT